MIGKFELSRGTILVFTALWGMPIIRIGVYILGIALGGWFLYMQGPP